MKRISFLTILLLTPLWGFAQVTATIRDVGGTFPVDAYDINWMGVYHPHVVYKADVYAAWWQSGGPSNPSGTWTWNPVTCTNIQYPPAGYPECNDRVFLGWKHISCAAGGACGTNDNWNIYPGASNYPDTNYYSWAYLGKTPSALQSAANWASALNFPPNRRYLPPVGNPAGTQYTGAGQAAVVYTNGKWFMAYDQNIIYPPSANADTHRIAWATSADGANWTYWGIIARDKSEEYGPGNGILVSDLYFDNNTFYLLVTSLGTNQIYLMKANYSSTNQGFDGWRLPTSRDGANNLIYPPTPNVSPDTTIDFQSGAYSPLFSALNNKYNPQATVAKVYTSNTSALYRYVFLVDVSPQTGSSSCPGVTNSYPLRIFTSTAMEQYQTSFYDIMSAQNSSHATMKGAYGWNPNIPFIVPDATYTRAYNPLSLFVSRCDTDQNRNNLARVQLVLSGDIY